MKTKGLFQRCLLFGLLLVGIFPPTAVEAFRLAPANEVTAYDLIVAMNSLRLSNGLPALIEDPIVDAVAQSTAQVMADNQMSWHIGDVSGRLSAAGYGGGAKVWATENFAVGTNQSIDQIMLVWADAAHMLPAVTAAYCHVGAGTAQAANGRTYYILQAAYVAGKACGAYSPGGAVTPQPGATAVVSSVSQIIVPVKIATPDADGKVFHVVQAGQSFWSIAIAYKITIKDLKSWNNLPETATLKAGQKLFIPGSNTVGYLTPTQAGGVQLATPDAEGRIVHTVQPYQTLSTIAQAYGTTVDSLLALNGLQLDWPLRIGQTLVIRPSALTPTSTLMPIQRLTPASDGRYYHTVLSGETLFGIAKYYGLPLADLMAWNGLSDASIIRPGQTLLLLVTPPATATSVPSPMTVTLPPTLTSSPAATMPTPNSPVSVSSGRSGDGGAFWLWSGLLVSVLLLAFFLGRFWLARRQ